MNWQAFFLAHGWEILLMGILLGCSAFFSGTETALFNLTRGQLHRFSRENPLKQLVPSIMHRPQDVLNTLLLGNMIVNTAFAAISATLVLELEERGAGAWAVGAASLGSVLGLILAGEVMPKAAAFVLSERWAPLGALPTAFFMRIFQPVLWLLWKGFVYPITRLAAPRRLPSAVTVEELDALLELSARRGVIDRDAGQMLQEIIQLEDLRVRDVMRPRVDIIAFDVAAPVEELIELFRRSRRRKITVYEGDLDHILGVVHAKRLFLSPQTPIRQLLAPAFYVPEAANLERLLLHFRVTRNQMAIVVDEYGGTAGLVTLEDVLEVIVGDIADSREAQETPAVQRLGPQEYLVDGDLAIHEWVEAFGMDLGGPRITTIGGFVCSLLGRIPKVGDTARYRNLEFTVQSMRGRRLGTLRLRLETSP